MAALFETQSCEMIIILIMKTKHFFSRIGRVSKITSKSFVAGLREFSRCQAVQHAPPMLSAFWCALLYKDIVKTPDTKGSAIWIPSEKIGHEKPTVVATTPTCTTLSALTSMQDAQQCKTQVSASRKSLVWNLRFGFLGLRSLVWDLWFGIFAFRSLVLDL